MSHIGPVNMQNIHPGYAVSRWGSRGKRFITDACPSLGRFPRTHHLHEGGIGGLNLNLGATSPSFSSWAACFAPSSMLALLAPTTRRAFFGSSSGERSLRTPPARSTPAPCRYTNSPPNHDV